jgi:hypothetical protein
MNDIFQSVNLKGSPLNVVGSGIGKRFILNELAIACAKLTESWAMFGFN